MARTKRRVLGICAVASVWDDVHYSGVHTADDFAAMCKAAKVEPREIEAQVKKAHQLAFRDAEKARKEKLKAEQRATSKNSVDPKQVSAAKEQEIATAADEVAKEKLLTHNPQLKADVSKAGDYFHCDTCGGVCAVGADLVTDVAELPEGDFECEECSDGTPIFGTTFALVANQEDFEHWQPTKAKAAVKPGKKN